MNEYLLNLGLFYCVVIPDKKKCFILNCGNSMHADIQAFLSGAAVDYSNYPSTWFSYNEDETWTNYQDIDNSKHYCVGTDLSEEEYINKHILKKYADGILVAIRDSQLQKSKVYKKNIHLHGEMATKLSVNEFS